MIIPPTQLPFELSKIPSGYLPQDFFTLACQRKHMGNAEQSTEGLGMVLLCPFLGPVEFISI